MYFPTVFYRENMHDGDDGGGGLEPKNPEIINDVIYGWSLGRCPLIGRSGWGVGVDGSRTGSKNFNFFTLKTSGEHFPNTSVNFTLTRITLLSS